MPPFEKEKRMTFGQFCPVALASEVLTQKWMLLIIRELTAGSQRFNDIRRGVPRISATLLKQRLDQLEHAGIVRRTPQSKAATPAYQLTEAGRDLKPVLGAIGEWGQRWAREIEEDDLDAGWLVWGMHRRLDLAQMPPGQTVLEIEFTDAPKDKRFFWLVCGPDKVDVCLKPPGHEVDLAVSTDVRTLGEVWRGIRPLQPELAAGRVRLTGPRPLQQAFPDWLMLSIFAGIERRR
ncbi:transcriptional regulator [Paremcibacter congregatus]|uniref:Transcriptional regulator n=2 Tax=Paremcibacter congregatus TaxID=2043170 RepID=A0A2G4YSM9_9PROT|nr:transcriptional regulator [Paremcibacter congregatus]QDE27731.1 helix-turn-helix transcriptional regulator [Paremcibacter congregatus]